MTRSLTWRTPCFFHVSTTRGTRRCCRSASGRFYSHLATSTCYSPASPKSSYSSFPGNPTNTQAVPLGQLLLATLHTGFFSERRKLAEDPAGERTSYAGDRRFTGVLRLGFALCQYQHSAVMAPQRGYSSLSLIERLAHSRQDLTRFQVYAALELSGGETRHRFTRGGSGSFHFFKQWQLAALIRSSDTISV